MENEKILGVYPIEIRGTFLMKNCDGYFTNRRLIGNYREGSTYTKFYGPGCLVWGYKFEDWAIFRPLTRRRNLVVSENPDEILQGDKRNVSFDYANIKSVTFKRMRGSWGQHILVIESFDGKKQLLCYDPKQRNDILRLWQEVIPNKVIVNDK